MTFKLQGSIRAGPPLDGGRVDLDALRGLMRWHVDEGSAAIVVCGTTGESAALEAPERTAIIGTAVDAVGGRIPIIAGTGSNSTHDAIALTARGHCLDVRCRSLRRQRYAACHRLLQQPAEHRAGHRAPEVEQGVDRALALATDADTSHGQQEVHGGT